MWPTFLQSFCTPERLNFFLNIFERLSLLRKHFGFMSLLMFTGLAFRLIKIEREALPPIASLMLWLRKWWHWFEVDSDTQWCTDVYTGCQLILVIQGLIWNFMGVAHRGPQLLPKNNYIIIRGIQGRLSYGISQHLRGVQDYTTNGFHRWIVPFHWYRLKGEREAAF